MKKKTRAAKDDLEELPSLAKSHYAGRRGQSSRLTVNRGPEVTILRTDPL